MGTGTHALVAVIMERLHALLIIKLKPLTSVHTSWSAVLRCMWWPGRRLTCPVGLLGGRCDCRSFAGQDACSPPTAVEWRHCQRADDTVMCTSLHPFIFSCNWWNWKRFNSLTWFATYTTHQHTRILVHRGHILYTFCMEIDALWVLPGCWLYITVLQYSFTMSAV